HGIGHALLKSIQEFQVRRGRFDGRRTREARRRATRRFAVRTRRSRCKDSAFRRLDPTSRRYSSSEGSLPAGSETTSSSLPSAVVSSMWYFLPFSPGSVSSATSPSFAFG